MVENNTLKIITDDGHELLYEILLHFKWFKTGKKYIIYTDNSYDENNNLNVYSAIYDNVLLPIETEEEKEEIKKRIKDLLIN